MCASHLKQKELIKLGDADLSKKIAEYIEENLFEEITVEEICDKFGIKKTKLYQITGHSFGKSFRAEILTLRMQKAREMLRNSDKKIYEIAETVGYPDYNYFTKVFKKETGMTPRNYRNQYYSSQGEL
ncbi:MAG: AraC family transcriptional regulator [Eubacteriales bacterium]|nr:AraC family transcriptional regulator [Eubacteriales bacterium]